MAIQGYYRFNGNSNDASGNGRNGTSTLVTYPSGLHKNVILYPNTNKRYTTLGQNFNFTSEDFTISFWVNIKSFTTSVNGQYPIIFWKGGYNTKGYYGQIQPNTIAFFTNQSGANQLSTADGEYNINIWYNITITRQGSTVYIYVNGVNKTSTSTSHINPATSTDNYIINSYNLNYMMGNTSYDEYIIDQKKWEPSEVKNKYSYYKGFF